MVNHEIAVLAYLVSKGVHELFWSRKISKEFFEDINNRKIYDTICSLTKEKSNISTKDLSFILGKEVSKELMKIRRYIRNLPSEDLVLKSIGIKLVKDAILKEVPNFNSLNIDYYSIKKAIEEAENLQAKKISSLRLDQYAKDYDLFSEDSLESYTFIKGPIVYEGEVGMIVGPTGRGKTLGLVNIGAINMLYGMKVAHWSLEINYKQLFNRYCSRMLGKKSDSEADIQEVSRLIRLYGGDLIVRDDPYCNITQIRDWVLDEKPDLLIVDYADLMIPLRKYKERRFEIREIFLGLRNLAKEVRIPVWTASQTTSKSMTKNYITVEDLEEAKIAKGGTCSLIMSLNQTEEEKEEGYYRVFICKATNPAGKKRRFCSVNYEAQYIKEETERGGD